MKEYAFDLDNGQLMEIAALLKERIVEGLEKEKQQVLCLPTYINPKKDIADDRVLVLDLGGTNCRVAVIEFKDGKPSIHPEGGWKKKELAHIMKEPGCTQEKLFAEIADLLYPLDLTGVKSIGYCFSYPASSTLDGYAMLTGEGNVISKSRDEVAVKTEGGRIVSMREGNTLFKPKEGESIVETDQGDAILLRWTKGVNIPEMVGQPVGKPLMEYLNVKLEGKARFEKIKVINDTVASLFAGLTDTGADAYIGLIVGTGTNMAALLPSSAVTKMNENHMSGKVPVNLESGNFDPPYLSTIDDKIDRYSDNRGNQRFEKAISGMYLGRILEYIFYSDRFEGDFDASNLTHMMSYSDRYKEKYVKWAYRVYERSTRLVAASLAGLILELVACDPTIKNIRLTAEGSLFWSEDGNRYSYKDSTMTCLRELLDAFDLGEVKVSVEKQENANLIGSAVAGLS